MLEKGSIETIRIKPYHHGGCHYDNVPAEFEANGPDGSVVICIKCVGRAVKDLLEGTVPPLIVRASPFSED